MSDSEKTSAPEPPESQSLSRLDCRELFSRYSSGEGLAAAEFVSLYRAPVYSFLLRWGFQSTVCDDLFQDVFARIHVSRASYDTSRSLPSWIFGIVVNVVRTHWQKHSTMDEEYEDDKFGQPDGNVVERLDAKRWLERALPTLPSPQREVIILCCIHEMSMEETARALQIPPNTVKTHLRRARQNLTERYMKQQRASEREVLI